MITRSTVVTAAVAAAAALAATGITYASAATSEPARAAAPAIQQAAPASALGGGDVGKGNEGKGNNDRGGHDEGGRGHYEGRVHINERTYTDDAGGCVTVVSGLGSRTLNIRNDSRRTIEVFRGVTCDNGAPIATVGPHSTSNGVRPGHVSGGVYVENGVVGSFRVIDRHDDEGGRNW
ncbi:MULTISPECIES: hypothetical protein [Streptomyces]|uniref:hypothetical protein n=1 Tax=Streptomyces TaxID=1883 RepID=UPI0021A5B73D|nr:hypothetical protein [Streptomyces atratus]MCT2547140.1 hypothetical protein [Streptomyces atratus]